MTTFCHSLSYADARRQLVGRWLSERSEHGVIPTRRSELVAYAEKFYACTKILCVCRQMYGLYAASTLCTRYANVPRVRGTVGVRWRNVHSTLTWVDTKCVNFTTSPLRVGSEFWTFYQRTVCVFSAYAYRIKIDSALVSVFIARSHRIQNERVTYA